MGRSSAADDYKVITVYMYNYTCKYLGLLHVTFGLSGHFALSYICMGDLTKLVVEHSV